MKKGAKTLVQCDFDGTVTEEDVSYIILDAFAGGDWKKLTSDYEESKITVGRFNSAAFSMVKAGKESLLERVNKEVTIRPGFGELVAFCRRSDIRFVIVSNGLQFYIEDILKNIGMTDIEVHAAETQFSGDGLKVQYVGPSGNYLDNDFKVAYLNSFLNQGYRVIYVGNGSSDVSPAAKSHHIFATGTLLKRCREAGLECTPFSDHNDIVSILESWQ